MIAYVKREMYFPYCKKRGAAVISARYVGEALRREEVLCYESSSDWGEGYRVRTSDDNGRTWSDWRLLHEEWPEKDGFSKEQSPFAWCYDPVSNNNVQFVFQRLLVGKGNEAIRNFWKSGRQTMFDHNFRQVSDDGRTWGEPRLLRYEDGPDFDPGNWANEGYLRTNQMYGGYSAVATREGAIVYPSCGVPMEITDRGETEKVEGALCFIGKWNPCI